MSISKLSHLLPPPPARRSSPARRASTFPPPLPPWRAPGLAAALVVALATAAPAQILVIRSAPWERRFVPSPIVMTASGSEDWYDALGTHVGHLVYTATAGGDGARGTAEAWDKRNFHDVGAACDVTGGAVDHWVYTGSRIGHLEGYVNLGAQGKTDLIDAAAGGIAAGYVEYWSNTEPQGAVAELDSSNGETEPGLVVATTPIATKNPNRRFTFPLLVGSSGVYPRFDSDTDQVVERRCTREWEYHVATNCRLEVRADGNLLDRGEVRVEMTASLAGQVILSELNPDRCP